jgi:hypothetical protein
MKAKELAELLLEHPDFDVRLILATQAVITPEKPWPEYRNLSVSGIGDIGYSSRVILLEVD